MTVNLSGPVFDGRAESDADLMLDEIQGEVADYALFQWRANLEGSWREATGHYMSKTQLEFRDKDYVVNDGYPDSLVEYGPWLEGVGTRNQSTRFKGYFAMRRAAGQVTRKVGAIAEPIAQRWTKRMSDA